SCAARLKRSAKKNKGRVALSVLENVCRVDLTSAGCASLLAAAHLPGANCGFVSRHAMLLREIPATKTPHLGISARTTETQMAASQGVVACSQAVRKTERGGFEPPRAVYPPCRFSKPVHSTTLPSLRIGVIVTTSGYSATARILVCCTVRCTNCPEFDFS